MKLLKKNDNIEYSIVYIYYMCVIAYQLIISKSICKPSELVLYIFVAKNLITMYWIEITKPEARGISGTSSGDSYQSFPKWKL